MASTAEERRSKSGQMARAKKGDTVKLHYTGEAEGQVFVTTEGSSPAILTLGMGGILPAFEANVAGMKPGESKTVKIPASQAYGPYNIEMVYEVHPSEIPVDFELEVGQQFNVRQKDGRVMEFEVVMVSPEKVRLDGNHPLAGRELVFHIQLLEIM